MTDFAQLQTQISAERGRKASASADLAAQRERIKKIDRELAILTRAGGNTEQIAALRKERAATEARVAAATETFGGSDATLGKLLGQLAGLATPDQQIAQLTDDTPILLFPVRLETRFRTVQTAATVAAGTRLAIRIYPDACQIDGFEETLSDSELANLQAFWIAMWRAGGVEAQERGAWRSLVGSSGSGRAAYAIGVYAPGSAAAKPVKAAPEDVILVIAPAITVTPAEQTAAFAYWRAVWSADGDASKENAAFDTLRTTLGDDARARAIVDGFAPDPVGWDPPAPHTRADVTLTIAVITLPPPPATKATSWTTSPKAVALPDRFVALLYRAGAPVRTVVGNPVKDGLATGPDPSLPPDQQIHVVNDDLVLDDNLHWLGDFATAVSVGMGIDVPLSAEEARGGFDRVVVVGLRFSSDAADSKTQLETLISHQLASKDGYGLVPQGSPTNNTDASGAAFSWVDDPDASYDRVFLGKEAYVESTDPLARRDGEWLAEALGIDDALVKKLPHAAGVDQAEVRAMNIALWNGTLGYMLEEMMTPVFSRADIASTRLFFTQFVSGRGPVPAVRVGNQPYGVLPAIAFSRFRATDGEPRLTGWSGAYQQRLHGLLGRLDATWRNLLPGVAHVGNPGDAHQTLLDIVGLHPGSVEYHQRYAESFDQLYNKLVLELGGEFAALLASWLRARGSALLTQLGADPTVQPPILEKFFYGSQTLLDGPLVDDRPLSETSPIRAYTTDGKNYIEWLSTSSLDAIRRQDFGGKPEPIALLYLMLRHAMMLGQWDAGIRFLENRGLIDPIIARTEPSFIGVQAAGGGESKLAPLYRPAQAVTGDSSTLLADYVLRPNVLATAPENEDLREIVGALQVLAQSPTARLERVFAEHVDCCSYRLDAWKTGLGATRLAELRARRPTGIYLGAYGWVEDLRPRTAPLQPKRLEGDLAKTFQREGDAPLSYDPANAGYIHAPSLNHAATAAILKNAYRVNATPANPDAMAVNLSSDRVRKAQTIFEGMRNGQSIGALLGYRFERGLHDDHALAEVDKFIYPLRQIFPLVANQLKTTQTQADITLLEARNVLDGQALVARARAAGNAHYPFGFPIGGGPGQLPSANAAEQLALDTEVDRLLDLDDALGDLVLAESVYQVVLGNFDRAGAVTTAFNQGGNPPEIQVVDTPRNGRSLSHRLTLHLDSTVTPVATATPRARAEAPLDSWLASVLPDPAHVVVSVSYATPAMTATKTVVLTQQDLGLQSIDLLYSANLELEQQMAELDDRIQQLIRYGNAAHPELANASHPSTEITIDYTVAVPGNVTFFELAALIRSLRALLLRSRALRAADLLMPLEAKSEDGVWNDGELSTRVGDAVTALGVRRAALAALATDASDLDVFVRKVSDELLATARFGMPQTGTGDLHGDVRAIYDAIEAKIVALVQRWTDRATQYDALMATWGGLTNDADRFTMLRAAERLIAATSTSPVPADPNVYRTAIQATRATFDAHLADFKALLSWNGKKLVDYVAAVVATLPEAAPHDLTPPDITDQQTAITTLHDRIVSRINSLVSDLDKRIADASAALTVAATQSVDDRIQSLVAAARRVLGDEFVIVPRFTLPHTAGVEFANAWSATNALLTDLRDPAKSARQFPVDDWLYGIARVRDKAAAWEDVTVLAEGFGSKPIVLTPVQLPYAANDRWMALEFDATQVPAGDRVLVTAHFEKAFKADGEQAGLMLDEWPEVVPDSDVVTGLTFHYDRPNAQPPQVQLLALPAARTGHWSWDELVATITETLDGAKTRAVEPAQLDATSYAQFLPATVQAVTLYWITIATNLALNKNIYSAIGGA